VKKKARVGRDKRSALRRIEINGTVIADSRPITLHYPDPENCSPEKKGATHISFASKFSVQF
jgi:hypothetical protein